MELIQQFILSKVNLRQEVTIPDCFIDFRGENMQNTVQNETFRYALSFGDKSKFDTKSSSLFKEFAAKIMDEKFNGDKPRTYLGML